MKLKKKVKGSSSIEEEPVRVLSTREKMLQRKKQLESRGNSTGILYPKEGTMRVRLISQGPDKEIGLEIIQFYLGNKIGGIISPATFDEPCPFMEKYRELKDSKDESDNSLASLLVPRRRYIVGGTCYKDEKGKEVDPERIRKPILIPSSVYQGIIDLYLDEDDWGDMTDKEEGYDIKISRTGSGKNNTVYSVNPCPGRKPLNSKYVEDMDLENIIRKGLKSYEELEDLLHEYLEGGTMPEEEEEIPRKKKRSRI